MCKFVSQIDYDHHSYITFLEVGAEEEPKVMIRWFVMYTSMDTNSMFTKTNTREKLSTKIKRLI